MPHLICSNVYCLLQMLYMYVLFSMSLIVQCLSVLTEKAQPYWKYKQAYQGVADLTNLTIIYSSGGAGHLPICVFPPDITKKTWQLIMKLFYKRVVYIWHSNILILRLTQYARSTRTTPNSYCIDQIYTIYIFFLFKQLITHSVSCYR